MRAIDSTRLKLTSLVVWTAPLPTVNVVNTFGAMLLIPKLQLSTLPPPFPALILMKFAIGLSEGGMRRSTVKLLMNVKVYRLSLPMF